MSPRRPSTSLTSLRSIQRFRRLSTWFRVRKNLRRLQREQTRLSLLEKEHRHQLLLLKELQQERTQLLHRQQELSPLPSLEQLSSLPSSPSLPLESSLPENSPPMLSPALEQLLQMPRPEKDSIPQQ